MIRILLTTIFSLAAHLLLGWTWTLGAGILGGALADQRGWFVGAAGVALGWALLVIYSFAVAAAPTRIMADSLGQIFGNIPAAAIVGGTVLLGALLGGFGGAIGQMLPQVTGIQSR